MHDTVFAVFSNVYNDNLCIRACQPALRLFMVNSETYNDNIARGASARRAEDLYSKDFTQKRRNAEDLILIQYLYYHNIL